MASGGALGTGREGMQELSDDRDGRQPDDRGRSTLVLRNVRVSGRRTSLRLEPQMWDALDEIALREGLSVGELCTKLDGSRSASALTAAVRVFIMSYFRGRARWCRARSVDRQARAPSSLKTGLA